MASSDRPAASDDVENQTETKKTRGPRFNWSDALVEVIARLKTRYPSIKSFDKSGDSFEIFLAEVAKYNEEQVTEGDKIRPEHLEKLDKERFERKYPKVAAASPAGAAAAPASVAMAAPSAAVLQSLGSPCAQVQSALPPAVEAGQVMISQWPGAGATILPAAATMRPHSSSNFNVGGQLGSHATSGARNPQPASMTAQAASAARPAARPAASGRSKRRKTVTARAVGEEEGEATADDQDGVLPSRYKSKAAEQQAGYAARSAKKTVFLSRPKQIVEKEPLMEVLAAVVDPTGKVELSGSGLVMGACKTQQKIADFIAMTFKEGRVALANNELYEEGERVGIAPMEDEPAQAAARNGGGPFFFYRKHLWNDAVAELTKEMTEAAGGTAAAGKEVKPSGSAIAARLGEWWSALPEEEQDVWKQRHKESICAAASEAPSAGFAAQSGEQQAAIIQLAPSGPVSFAAGAASLPVSEPAQVVVQPEQQRPWVQQQLARQQLERPLVPQQPYLQHPLGQQAQQQIYQQIQVAVPAAQTIGPHPHAPAPPVPALPTSAEEVALRAALARAQGGGAAAASTSAAASLPVPARLPPTPPNPNMAWLPEAFAPLEEDLVRLKAPIEMTTPPHVLEQLAAALRSQPSDLALLAQLRRWINEGVLLLNGQLRSPDDPGVTAEHLKHWLRTFYPAFALGNTQLKHTLINHIAEQLIKDTSTTALGSRGAAAQQRVALMKRQAEAAFANAAAASVAAARAAALQQVPAFFLQPGVPQIQLLPCVGANCVPLMVLGGANGGFIG